MKKLLVLSAIAASVAAPAFAQSSVTIYGRVNVSVEKQKTGDVSDSTLVDNASRIGFKGTEDLGGGLKANFVIEHGFNAATGKAAGAMWGREATVGLSGSFGAIRLGNMAASDAYFATSDYVDMHNHGTGTSSDAFYGGPVVGGLQTAVTYTTPTFSGASASLQYANANANGDNPTAFAANYDLNDLHLGLGYEKLGDAKMTAVRAAYTMGAFTLGGYFEKDSGTLDRTNIRLAGMYTQGASEFHLSFGKAGEANDVPDSGATQLTLAYNYNLSKRTKVYGFFTKVNKEDAAADDFQSFALGLRHDF